MLFGYYRVSTKGQEDGSALERYREQLIQFGVKEENIFWDIGSGGSDRRQGYQDLLAALRESDGGMLVFPTQSRLARDEIVWAQLYKECQSLNIEMFSLDRGKLNIHSPLGIFTNSVLAATDAMQRRINQELAIKGHQYLRDKKIAHAAPFGYRIEEGKPVFDDRPYHDSGRTRFEVAREAIKLFLEHQKPRPVLREIEDKYGAHKTRKGGFPRESTGFYRWIETETLRGCLVYRPGGKVIVHPNNHEPLILPEEWQIIKTLLVRNRAHRRAKVNLNPLVGLAFCGVCGSRLTLQQSHGKYFYLVCAQAKSYRSDRQCWETETYGLRLQDFVRAVTDALRSRAEQLVAYGWQSGSAPDSPEVIELRSQIEGLELLDDPDLESAIDRKRDRLTQLIEQAIADTASSRNAIDVLLALHESDCWEEATYQELADIFRETVASVVHTKGAIEIKLRV
jgi:site-specific DNA recombinase